MSAIAFACISPHPPVIVREGGRGREPDVQRTIDALEQVAGEMTVHRPETALIMATHGPLNPGAFVLLTAFAAEGDLARWGPPPVQALPVRSGRAPRHRPRGAPRRHRRQR